ncbi:MAG: DNA-binding protein [Methanosphaera stadtmanae]|jgi:programmed cell death protein 5|nr:DNA-binding protein [Methanosphaera stadtmanae]
MTELDDIRRRRMEELKQQQLAQQQQGVNLQQMQQEQEMRERYEAEKKQALKQILTPEARQRLANLRLTKPELVNSIEVQLIQLAQAKRIQLPVTDDILKQILREASGKKREIHITRK